MRRRDELYSQSWEGLENPSDETDLGKALSGCYLSKCMDFLQVIFWLLLINASGGVSPEWCAREPPLLSVVTQRHLGDRFHGQISLGNAAFFFPLRAMECTGEQSGSNKPLVKDPRNSGT